MPSTKNQKTTPKPTLPKQQIENNNFASSKTWAQGAGNPNQPGFVWLDPEFVSPDRWDCTYGQRRGYDIYTDIEQRPMGYASTPDSNRSKSGKSASASGESSSASSEQKSSSSTAESESSSSELSADEPPSGKEERQ